MARLSPLSPWCAEYARSTTSFPLPRLLTLPSSLLLPNITLFPRADLFKHSCSDYDSLLHLPPVYLSYLTGPDHQHCSLTRGIWLLPSLTRSGSLALTAQYLAHVQVDHRHLAKPSDCQYHSSLEAPTRSLQASRSRDLPLSVRSTCGFFHTLAIIP